MAVEREKDVLLGVIDAAPNSVIGVEFGTIGGGGSIGVLLAVAAVISERTFARLCECLALGCRRESSREREKTHFGSHPGCLLSGKRRLERPMLIVLRKEKMMMKTMAKDRGL